MGMFGKRRDGDGGGLGRSVVNSDGLTLDKAIVDTPSIPASETIVDAQSGAAPLNDGVVLGKVVKPSRAERKAEAKIAKAAGAKQIAVSDVLAASPKQSRAERKAEAEAAEAASDALRPSNKVMIEFYPGMAKEDAIETARHWAMTHMDMPSLCFYYVQKMQDGFAVEVQEGVGKAYLPSVIKLAMEKPGRLIIVPMIRRKMTVYYSARTGEFEAQILPELQEPPVMPENPAVQAVRGVAMTPVMKQHREWLIVGGVTAAIGGLALLSSITFYAFDPKAKVPPEWRTTDVAQLPIMQWGRLQADSKDSFVVRMEYADGQWRVVRQAVGASVDVSKPTGTDSSDQVQAGSAEGGTAAPGAAPAGQAPGAAPPAAGQGVSIPPPGPVPANS